MMKYELALVLSAKIEDEERAAMVEKVQAMITTAGAAITNVDEWGKKQLAYEIQKMKEGYYYFIQFEGETTVQQNLKRDFVLRKLYYVSYALNRCVINRRDPNNE